MAVAVVGVNVLNARLRREYILRLCRQAVRLGETVWIQRANVSMNTSRRVLIN